MFPLDDAKRWLRLTGVAGAILLGLAACAPPKIMLSDSFLPGTDKAARESIQQVGTVKGSKDDVILTNYYVQVCDVDGRQQTNCKTTLVLENITDYQLRTPGGL